jgi:uncharacterized protein YkwD
MTGRFLRQTTPALLLSLLLAACGGGNQSASTTSNDVQQPVTTTPGTGSTVTAEPGSPQSTGNTATDGFNWFNFRRQQAGLAAFTRVSTIDTAAQAHSNYQKLNDTITHEETAGKSGFTGVTPGDRLSAAGYTGSLAAYGEVISSTGTTAGFNSAEDLITAIYHRFVILEPVFRQAGTGAATTSGGTTYLTADFVAATLSGGLGKGKLVNYPAEGQTLVPRNFFSDNEVPDPVPNQNEVGFPISVHADITSAVAVSGFSIQPHGGTPLAVRLLTHAVDAETPASGAAIIPLSPLAAGTTYDVAFAGTVDGVAVSRNWSFTTK